MPLTRSMRADYNARYDGWNPEENDYFIKKLYHAARGDLVSDLEELRLTLEYVARQMTNRFGRNFHLVALKLKLERINENYLQFKDFLSQPGVEYDPYLNRTRVSNLYWAVVSPLDEPRVFRRYRMEGLPHYRKLRYVFDIKHCAQFPRSLLGSRACPILNAPADDDTDSEAAAPPIEEVNPLAIVPYEGPDHGADLNVNGGGGVE